MPVAAEKKEFSDEVLEAAGLFAGHPMEAEYYAKPAPESFVKPRTETVILFDWDDTLLASTVLATKGYRLDGAFERCPETEAQLRALERAVCSVLTTAARYGKVHIVTNAEHGWVQLSAQRFMPGVLPVLDLATVVSARSTYEAMYPGQPLQWKVSAMQERLRESFEEPLSMKNVLSFGDSHVEREAVKIAACRSPHGRVKSIKFAERPSIEQLRRQLELVASCFGNLHAYEGDLDLMLQITPTEPASPSTVPVEPTPAAELAAHTPAQQPVQC